MVPLHIVKPPMLWALMSPITMTDTGFCAFLLKEVWMVSFVFGAEKLNSYDHSTHIQCPLDPLR